MFDVVTISQKQVWCQSEWFRGSYYKREIMPVLGIIYMRSYRGHETSRDVRYVFLTSLDNMDDFIYRGNGVPEEFRGTFLIWKQCRRGQISSYGQNLI